MIYTEQTLWMLCNIHQLIRMSNGLIYLQTLYLII